MRKGKGKGQENYYILENLLPLYKKLKAKNDHINQTNENNTIIPDLRHYTTSDIDIDIREITLKIEQEDVEEAKTELEQKRRTKEDEEMKKKYEEKLENIKKSLLDFFQNSIFKSSIKINKPTNKI